jgi:hypothetical protein
MQAFRKASARRSLARRSQVPAETGPSFSACSDQLRGADRVIAWKLDRLLYHSMTVNIKEKASGSAHRRPIKVSLLYVTWLYQRFHGSKHSRDRPVAAEAVDNLHYCEIGSIVMKTDYPPMA